MPKAAKIKALTLLERVEKLEEELTKTRAKLAAAVAEIKRKDQIIDALKQRLFGSSSERLDPAQQQLEFDAETLGKPEALESVAGDGAPEPEEDEKSGKRTRTKKKDLFPKNLKVVIREVIVPDEVKANPEGYVKIDEEHHDELETTRAELYWNRITREKYVKKTDKTLPPLMAAAPAPSIPGTLCGPDLMAKMLVDKYDDHLPHYRQSKRFARRYQARISRQTINGWTHAAARYLAPIVEAIKCRLLSSDILQIDETEMFYLKPGLGKTKRGYLWAYRDQQSGSIYFDWQVRRAHECLLAMLGLDGKAGSSPFRGLIQCDGHSSYRALVARFTGILLGACLAHIRRKFYESRAQSPKLIGKILAQIQKLYAIESELKMSNAPPGTVKKVRRARSRPICEKLYETILAERKNHLPASNLGGAINYALGQWEEFIRYLDDGRMAIDNNAIENAIRPTKLGLKNYMFIGSAEAGGSSAMIYTLLANCRVQGIDPEKYLAEAIRRMTENTTVEEAAALTPEALAPALRPDLESAAA